MKILVTGGSGFIGTNLLEDFISSNVDVYNVDIVPPRNKEHTKYWHHVDICDFQKLDRCVKEIGPDYVIHLAARTDLNETSGLEYYCANISGVENLVNVCCNTAGIKRVIFASSMLVNEVGYKPKTRFDYNPATLYGKSKVLTENIIFKNRNGLGEFCVVRPTSIWGEWFSEPYRNFFDFVLSSRFFHPGDKACTKTYGYIGNTVYQIRKLLHADVSRIHGKIFYLGDCPPLNISIWADEIAKLAGLPKPRKLPYLSFVLAAFVGDVLKSFGLRFPMTSFRLKNMTTDHMVGLSETYDVCGEPPFARRDGVIRTLRWIRGN